MKIADLETRRASRSDADSLALAHRAGVEFYRANGFIETGPGETRLKSGRPIACVFMRKSLEAP